MQQPDDIVFTKQPYVENLAPRAIKSMKFTTLSGEEIMKMAECQVYKGNYYELGKKPALGGLLDPRLDCALLYLQNRPENLLITDIPVPPNSIRPSRIMDDTQSHENDVTEKLKHIIQHTTSLRKELLEGRPGSYF